MRDKQKFDQLVSRARNIIITSHIGTDDDAVCSCLAVYGYLVKKFSDKKSRIVITDSEKKHWNDLAYSDKIEWVDDLTDHLKGVDLIIFLDGNQNSRFSFKSDQLDLTLFNSICIDHHGDENDPYTEYLGNRSSAATCQIIADLLFPKNMGIDKDLANILLIGIVGDTGCFKYVDREKSDVFLTAARLLEFGSPIQSLMERFDSLSFQEAEIVGLLFHNMAKVDRDGSSSFTYSYLEEDIFDKYEEGVVESAYHQFLDLFVRHISGYPWGFIVTPRKGKGFLKISFRALPGAPNVRLLAAEFSGGGHDLASGGEYIPAEGEKIDSKTVCEKIVALIKNTKLKMTSKE